MRLRHTHHASPRNRAHLLRVLVRDVAHHERRAPVLSRGNQVNFHWHLARGAATTPSAARSVLLMLARLRTRGCVGRLSHDGDMARARRGSVAMRMRMRMWMCMRGRAVVGHHRAQQAATAGTHAVPCACAGAPRPSAASAHIHSRRVVRRVSERGVQAARSAVRRVRRPRCLWRGGGGPSRSANRCRRVEQRLQVSCVHTRHVAHRTTKRKPQEAHRHRHRCG